MLRHLRPHQAGKTVSYRGELISESYSALFGQTENFAHRAVRSFLSRPAREIIGWKKEKKKKSEQTGQYASAWRSVNFSNDSYDPKFNQRSVKRLYFMSLH